MLRLFALIAALLMAPVAEAAKSILVFGDSLSAGFGIRQDAAWPVLMQHRLNEKRLDYSVVNASISGETTNGGRSRIADALARHKPNIVVVALGANDGLRGLPLAQLGANLGWMIGTAQAVGARVLLVGLQLPPNFGRYATDFQRSYVLISQRLGTGLVPHFLAPLGTERRWFQADNLHPVAAAQPLLAEQVLKALDALPPR